MLTQACHRKALNLLGCGHAIGGQFERLIVGRGSDTSYSARFFGTCKKVMVSDEVSNFTRRPDAHSVSPEDSSEMRNSTRRKLPLNPVVSLDPEWFTSVGQQPVNLSPTRWAVFEPMARRRVLLYYPAGSTTEADFPPGTRGYLYYKPPAECQPDISGSVRFRVLPADGSSFEQGSDLQTPGGNPWKIILYTIAKFMNYRPVASMLVKEGFVTHQTLNQLRQLPAVRIRSRSVVLYSLSEPFVTDLTYKPMSVFIITQHAMLAWKSFHQSAFSVNERGRRFPFKGLVRIRIEKAPFPQDANSHTVVLRVLEILEPVECILPEYQYQLAEPVAGELLMRKRLGGTKYTPWTFDLDKKGQNLGPLFEDITDP